MFFAATPKRAAMSDRSTEAPMEYEYTSRREEKPVWSFSEEELGRKRSRQSSEPPVFPPQHLPQPPHTFGANQNTPFLFHTQPPPQRAATPTWTPPQPQHQPPHSSSNLFPEPHHAAVNDEHIHDVDMRSEDSPDRTELLKKRPVASGALQRVYKARQQNRSRDVPRRRQKGGSNLRSTDDWYEEDDDDERVNEEEQRYDYDGDDDSTGTGAIAAATRSLNRTSHHYTLNMPSSAVAPSSPSDLPYVLLGYLQFFFNLSLVVLFLYVVVQFVLTVQKDVEDRISEHSFDLGQQIAMCALSYRNNHCADNRVPHMIQPCGEWEACMNRDPTVVGRARVGAEMMGEIVNSFVESISWKTLFFFLASLSFLTLFINSVLSLYRSRFIPGPGHGNNINSGSTVNSDGKGRGVSPPSAGVGSALPPSTPTRGGSSSEMSFPGSPRTHPMYHHLHNGRTIPDWPNPGRWEGGVLEESAARRRKLEGGDPLKIR